VTAYAPATITHCARRSDTRMAQGLAQVVLLHTLTSQKVTSLIAWRHQGLPFFGPFSGCGTAGWQGSEVAGDA
jgi:hypothetical protein